jgi:hypothetical protein
MHKWLENGGNVEVGGHQMVESSKAEKPLSMILREL